MSIFFKSTRTFLPNLLSLSVLAALQTVHAAEPATDSQLPVIVVTASRAPEAINTVPASISVITKDQIQQSPVNELPNLLRQDASLNIVTSGGYGQQTSIFTRGTESKHTLVLLDGVRINNATSSAAGINFLDTTDIGQIEVLKGPASVQYGSDAVGGVIQLISAKPTKQNLFTTVEGGENGLYKAILGADLVKDDAYLQIRGQKLSTDGSPVTTTAKEDSGYDQKGYSVKGGIDNDQYALSLEARGNQGKSEYVTGSDYDTPASQDFNNRLLNLKGRYTIAPDLNVNLRVSQFVDKLDQNESTDYVHSDQKEADLNIRWGFAPHQNVLFGVTSNKADAKALSTDFLGNQISFDHDVRSTGYYLQHQYQDAIFSTQAGVRVEDSSQFGTHTTGQLAGRIQVLPTTSVYANVGTAFRAPNAFELFSTTYTVSNPNLKPEESTSYEIGVNQQIVKGLDANLAVYRTNIDDLITLIYNPATFKSQNQNVAKTKLTGAEAGLKWKLDSGWFASGSYAYVQPIKEGQNGSSDSELLRRPRQTLTASAGLQLPQYGFSAELVSKSQAKEYDESYPTSGYAIGNLRGYWQALPNVRLFANVENFTDRKYATALANAPYGGFGSLSQYLAPRRQASLGITLNY
ncbi:TonB-dependent receptor plug domain-containing protein [Aquirhabdus parva]|uniref:TonB-dependent receptor n=1 Tax=Aquirhabdus parva TaxID=2283318 RepID=A0A345P441_9GAMM|nr:TonB-dependent receptor [Aquirhabdus parva]AXI02050.1 TonB-dependent receptor [Aquirhabdus parva]